MEYITPEEMKALEEGAAGYGLGVKDLMENAGEGVAAFIVSRFWSARRVCVVCGGGNNGGDGLVAARYLSGRYEVDVLLLTSPQRMRTEEARGNWDALKATKARTHIVEDAPAVVGLSRLLSEADVVVAAIFGTGVKGGVVNEPYATAISLVNASRGVKVAVDLPSGLDPETGEVSVPSVVADFTLALHLPKVGLRGREEFTGEVVIVPIGVRSER